MYQIMRVVIATDHIHGWCTTYSLDKHMMSHSVLLVHCRLAYCTACPARNKRAFFPILNIYLPEIKTIEENLLSLGFV